MARSFRLSDAMPLLVDILKAEHGILPEKILHKPNKFRCAKCQRYHLIYSNIGNEHRDFKSKGG